MMVIGLLTVVSRSFDLAVRRRSERADTGSLRRSLVVTSHAGRRIGLGSRLEPSNDSKLRARCAVPWSSRRTGPRRSELQGSVQPALRTAAHDDVMSVTAND